MKPVLLATAAIVLYAFQNVVLEQKLSRFPAVTLQIIFCLVMLPLAFGRLWQLRAGGETVAFPAGSMLAFTLVIGVVYFIADYCYLAAYTNGGTLMSVTTIAIMLPIFASLVKFAWVHELPNGYQLAGYAFAVIAIMLVGQGNR